MLLPRLIPEGSHFVRIPSSKRGTMRIILETVQRGARHWAGGLVPVDKALSFAARMAELYAADATQGQRAYARQRGRANTSLIMFPESVNELRFYLLVTPGAGLVRERERLADTHGAREHLLWGSQYELLQVQRPREHGGNRTWTWQLTDQRFEMLQASMLQVAHNPGKRRDRRDDLDSLVRALLRMPGYYGIRQQQLKLVQVGAQAWSRTHTEAETYAWPMQVGYLDKSFACYHQPHPLRLDVLVSALQHQRAQAALETTTAIATTLESD